METRHQPDSTRSCKLALRAVGAARGRPGGGRLLPVCGAYGVGRSPPPDPPSWVRAAGVRYPLAMGAGVDGLGTRHLPQNVLLRAGFVRCGGGTRAPRGGTSCLRAGRHGLHPLPSPTASPWGVQPGPATQGLWVRGAVGLGSRQQPHSARSCVLALRAVEAARGRRGGAPSACVWSVRGRALSLSRPPVLGACGRGPLPTGCGCGSCGRGDPSPTPQRALSRAGFARCGRGRRGPGGGASCLRVGRPGLTALPRPTARPWGVRPGPATHWLWGRGMWAFGPVTYPTARAPASCLSALWGRHEGACEERSCLRVGRSGLGALPRPTARPWGVQPGPATHWLWVQGVWAWGPVTYPTARAIASWLCVLWGRHEFLATVLVPRLWPAACLSGVPRRSALLRRASLGPVALGALVGFPVAVVPSPSSRAVAPGFTGRLRGARGGWPRTGLIVPAADPCRGRGAGLARRRTRSGPRDGVVPGGSLRLRSWAACGAVVWRVWTRSLTRPVSRTVRLSTGDAAGAPGLFRVDADTSPFGSEDATLGSRACVPVRALLGRVRKAGLPGAVWYASSSLWPFCPSSLFGPLRAGVALASGFFLFFSFFFVCSVSSLPFSLLAPPLFPALCASRPWCPGPLRSSFAPTPPHPARLFLFFLLVSFCCPAFLTQLRPAAPLSLAVAFACSRHWLSPAPFLIPPSLPPLSPPLPPVLCFFCFVFFHSKKSLFPEL